MPRHKRFNAARVALHDHSLIQTYLSLDGILPLKAQNFDGKDMLFGSSVVEIQDLAAALIKAREDDAPRILFMGGHPIKLGLSRYLCHLIAQGWFTHVATTGAGLIHDWQLTCHGVTDENVPATLAHGRFGFWDKLDQLNKVAIDAAHTSDWGLGELAGKYLHDNADLDDGPVLGEGRSIDDVIEYSVAANAHRAGVAFTVHVQIGTDIIGMYPGYNGCAWGEASYRDFRTLVEAVTNINGGVFINAGSAVVGPEVFLKAFSVAANIGSLPERFTAAVMDVHPLPSNWKHVEFTRKDPEYYWRPWKTILRRTVAGGRGQSLYIRGNFLDTIPYLWTRLTPNQSV